MEATGTDEVDKLKTKFISAWNNMKYSWVLKTKTYFSRNSPVLLLGKCYHFKYEVLLVLSLCPEITPGSAPGIELGLPMCKMKTNCCLHDQEAQ